MTTKFAQNLATGLKNTAPALPSNPVIDWNQWDGSKDPAPFVEDSGNAFRMVHIEPLGDGRFAVIETGDVDNQPLSIRMRIGKRVGNRLQFGSHFLLPSPYSSTSDIQANWMGCLIKIDDTRLFVVTRKSFGDMRYGIATYDGLEITSLGTAVGWGTDSNLSYPVRLSALKIMLFSYSSSNARFNYRIITVSATGQTFDGFTNGNIANSTGSINGTHATIRLEENKFAIASSHTNTAGTNVRGGQVLVGELTDPDTDTINTGDWFDFNDVRVDAISAIGISAGKFAIAYRNTGDANQGVVVPVNYSGVTVNGLGTAKETDAAVSNTQAGGTRLGLIDNKYVMVGYAINGDTDSPLSHQRALLNMYDLSSGELIDVRKNHDISCIQEGHYIHSIEKTDDYTVIIGIHGSPNPYRLAYRILSLTQGRLGQNSWFKRSGNFDSGFQNIHSRAINPPSDILHLGNRNVICGFSSTTNTSIALIVRFDESNSISITDTEEIESSSAPTDAKFVDLGNNLILALFRRASPVRAIAVILEVSGDQIIAKSASNLLLTTSTSFTYNSGNLVSVGTNKALCVFANSDDLKASFINVTDIDNFAETSQVVVGALNEYNDTSNETCAVCHKITDNEVLLVYTREVAGVKTDSIVLIDTSGALPVINTIVNLAEHTTKQFRVITLSGDLYLIAAVEVAFPQTEMTLYLVEKSGSSFILRHTYLMPLGGKHIYHFGQFITFDSEENKVLFAAPVGTTYTIRFYSIDIDPTAKQITGSAISGSNIFASTPYYSAFITVPINQNEIAVLCSGSPGTIAGILRRD